MSKSSWTPTCALAVAIALGSTAAFAEPKIGNATTTTNKVEGVVGGTAQPLTDGSDVYSNEVVRTGDAAVADLQFIDQTTMNIGPVSEVRLDKFVYDPSGTTGTVVIQATRGTFRFISGSQDKKSYEIKTPYGTLGIRG